MFIVFIVLIVLLCERKIVYSECLLRLVVLRVLCYSVCLFCTGHFGMVIIHLTCLHCLQHSFLEHFFNIYCKFIIVRCPLNIIPFFMYFTMQLAFDKKVRNMSMEKARVHKLTLDIEATFDSKV